MKTPRFNPPAAKTDPIVPLPDAGGAAVMQSKFDALKGALGKRGRSSTLLTWGKRGGSHGSIAMSGKLADIEASRTARTVTRA